MALLKSPRRARSRRHVSACRHLRSADPVLAQVMVGLGSCGLTPRREHFSTLCDSIISQQLSAAVAAIIFRRFLTLFPNRRPTPERLARLPQARLTRTGVSIQKARYLKALAQAFLTRRLQPRAWSRQSNDAIIDLLVSVHGVGRWTAQMFLIFALNRLDVLPIEDLGIRKAVQIWYGLRTLPSARSLRHIAKAWHPYESIACWYLWQSLRRRSTRAT